MAVAGLFFHEYIVFLQQILLRDMAFDNMTGRSSTPVTTNLIIINCILLMATVVFERKGIDLNDYLGLHYYDAPRYSPIQMITYLFMHGGFWHLFNNMFSLYMFGRLLEMVWGGGRFITYYLVTGVGAAIIQQLAWRYGVIGDWLASNQAFDAELTYGQLMASAAEQTNALITVGASGSVFGILLAFGMMFPNAEILLLIPPIPLKAKWLVIGYGVWELSAGVISSGDGIAHYAHLGGMLFGLILILFWRRHHKHEF